MSNDVCHGSSIDANLRSGEQIVCQSLTRSLKGFVAYTCRAIRYGRRRLRLLFHSHIRVKRVALQTCKEVVGPILSQGFACIAVKQYEEFYSSLSMT